MGQAVSADDVAAKTDVSVREAEDLLKTFKARGNSRGEPIDLEAFKKVMTEVHHVYSTPAYPTEAAELYFNMFDVTHDGKVDPYEFVAGMSIIATGTIEEKARLVFEAIDTKNDGFITKEELGQYIDFMLQVSEKIFKQKATPIIPVRLGAGYEYKERFKEMKPEIKEEIIQKTFALDSNKDGKISLEDWLKAAKDNNSAVNAFLNPYEPLTEIVREAVEEIHRELSSTEHEQVQEDSAASSSSTSTS